MIVKYSRHLPLVVFGTSIDIRRTVPLFRGVLVVTAVFAVTGLFYSVLFIVPPRRKRNVRLHLLMSRYCSRSGFRYTDAMILNYAIVVTSYDLTARYYLQTIDGMRCGAIPL